MKIKATNPEPPDVDMTPMIDIVFQLIAFFMVITNFEQTQADERVKLPRDALARPPEVKREDKLTLNIGFNRDKQGNIVPGPNDYRGPYLFISGEQVKIENAHVKLSQERAFFQALGKDMENVTVEIRADAVVPIGEVQKLIQACQEQEFQRFALKATQNRD
jgi:biopolymer transport protein ExbD